jgi:hypothetical protein
MKKPIEITVEITEGDPNSKEWLQLCEMIYDLYLENLAETS